MVLKPNKVGRMIDSDFKPEKIEEKCLNCGENYREYDMEGYDLYVCYCGLRTR